MAAVATALTEPTGADDLHFLKAQAATGLAHDPVDARMHSLVGEIHLRAGQVEVAHRYFEQANRLSKTEIHALQHLILRSIEDGDYAGAVRRMDTLLRRWPERFQAVAPAMPALFARQASYGQILEAVTANAPWRGRLFSSLAREEGSIDLAYRLILDLANSASPASRREIAVVANGFFRMRRYQDAYRMFLFTLPEEERPLSGYVFNKSFAPIDNPLPFNWQHRGSADADIRLSSTSPQGATVRFLNKPAKDVRLRQNIVLAPGRYRLIVAASATSLRLPRDLFWTLRCLDRNREILRLAIPEGSYQQRDLTAEFEIEGCEAQSIGLVTGLVSESWRHRYVGQVTFHQVLIERVERDQTEG